jgi:hypothetical protein
MLLFMHLAQIIVWFYLFFAWHETEEIGIELHSKMTHTYMHVHMQSSTQAKRNHLCSLMTTRAWVLMFTCGSVYQAWRQDEAGQSDDNLVSKHG